MGEVARFAGCSRGTLYRYFAPRDALHRAYVRHKAGAIHHRAAEAVAAVADPRERLVEYLLACVRAVREDPATSAWFVTDVSGLAARHSRAIDVIESLAAGIAPELPAAAKGDGDPTLRLRWLVRVIVSLLADPEPDPADERALVERFAVPACLAT
jgi:AcrR family transcriptional regulator